MSETHSALPARIYGDLIGKPFARGGRGPGEYDCWGALQTVLRRQGHDPTDFPTNPALLMQAIANEWQPIERRDVKPGDGVLLRSVSAEYVWHVAVVVDRYNMLHAREGVGICVERMDSPAHIRRIVGFYRYRGRA